MHDVLGDPSMVSSRSGHEVLDEHIDEFLDVVRSRETRKVSAFLEEIAIKRSIQ